MQGVIRLIERYALIAEVSRGGRAEQVRARSAALSAQLLVAIGASGFDISSVVSGGLPRLHRTNSLTGEEQAAGGELASRLRQLGGCPTLARSNRIQLRFHRAEPSSAQPVAKDVIQQGSTRSRRGWGSEGRQGRPVVGRRGNEKHKMSRPGERPVANSLRRDHFATRGGPQAPVTRACQ